MHIPQAGRFQFGARLVSLGHARGFSVSQLAAIPVVYASNSGNTKAGAELIAERLTAAKLPAEAVSASAISPTTVAKLPLVVIGSCSWLRQTSAGPTQGELPEFMHQFVTRLLAQPGITNIRVAIFGFGRHEYTHFCGAVDKLESALSGAGAELITDSLRVDGFEVQNRDQITEWADQLAAKIANLPQLA